VSQRFALDHPHNKFSVMRVIHVVPSVDDEASGPSYSVVRLCESLIETGANARVAALELRPRTRSAPYLTTFPLGMGPRRLGRSPEMHRWLVEEVTYCRAAVIHNHSLWMMPNVYPGKVCRRYPNCRLVVSPHGTLSSWALGFHGLRKKYFWRLLQGPAVRDAACFHATSDSEYGDIRQVGITQPICILPNGIDVPPLLKPPRSKRRRLLFFGRIHPVKGVTTLLRAWKAIQDRFRDWELHVVGPDDNGHLADVRALVVGLQLDRLVLSGPLYGPNKLNAYRAADLFVLPTHSDNFAMTVAEALAAGTPAVVTVAAPWSRLMRQGAGWSIDVGLDPLVACLEEALSSTPAQLSQMGQAGRRWMQSEFAWRTIAAQYVITYQWLLEGGSTPAWVRVN
jgi:glycosyltransferase involved in cell wall biosynthesis